MHAELFTPTGDDGAGLDEDELEILRDAGIIAGPSRVGRKRGSSRSQAKHIVFVENEEEGMYGSTGSHVCSYAIQHENTWRNKRIFRPPALRAETMLMQLTSVGENLKNNRDGRKKVLRLSAPTGRRNVKLPRYAFLPLRWTCLYLAGMQVHRTRLLKELSARLHRDCMLRYAERELEMQRMLMGKGRSKKVKGVERVEASDEEGEDTGRRGGEAVEERLYRPRVFRWRAERKR